MNFPSAKEIAQRTHRSLLSTRLWRARLVLWSGGLAVGGMAVAFAKCADLALAALHNLIHFAYWLPYFLAPFGFAGISFVTKRYFEGAEGSGIPQTIFAL